MDKNQKRQVHSRLYVLMTEIYEHLLTAGFKKEDIERFNPETILYHDSSVKIKKDTLKNGLRSKEPRFIFTIKEQSQIKRINALLKPEVESIILVLDEVHKTGAYKKDDEVYHDEMVKYDDSIVYTKEHAKKIINVSATAQDFVFVCDIFSDNIIRIKPGEFHTGIKDWIWDTSFSTKKDTKVSIMPESVFNYLKKKSDQELIIRHDRKNNKVDLHPYIVLCKYHRKLEYQNEMLEWFKNSVYKFSDDWTVIVYQGEGIHLYHKSLKKEPVYICTEFGEKQLSELKDGVHHFKSSQKYSVGISDCLQYLAERGVEKHPKIIIIGFDMCCEGISYTSHYSKPHNWHLTDMIAKFTSNTTVALQKQIISRVNGNHGDDIKPIIAVDLSVKEKVLHSHELNEKQLERCITSEDVKLCRDHIDDMIFFKNRVPKNFYKIKSISVNLVQNPDHKKEKKLMKSSDKSIDILNYIDPEKYKPILDEIIKRDDESKDKKKNITIKTVTTTHITITKTEVKTISLEDASVYYSIDIRRLTVDTVQHLIIQEVLREIKDRNQLNTDILRSTVNKWLLSLNNDKITDANHINGNFDNGIVPKMKTVKSNKVNGLIYWKNNGRFYLRLNQ